MMLCFLSLPNAGKLLLRPGLIEEKHPQLHVISAESVRAASQLGADFVVSIAVLGHVRPDELGVYFGNISSMMGKDSIAIITLNPSAMTKRCAGMTWDYSEADLARELRAVAPDLSVEFRWLSAATRDERNDLSGMILRRVTDQRKWDDTARFLASSGVSHEPVHQQPGAD